ncbi:serine hydrolase domain-containing protein [Glycocaulis abyssi]|uniref:Serine hydrolase domain-containing protein n=1 Tax=Glycocaulis abyssi TaxID=1433403 RepID=A0ABV9ND17_9PROT
MLTRRSLMASAAALAAGSIVPAVASNTLAPVINLLEELVGSGQLPFAGIRIARHSEILAQAHVSGVETIGPESLYRVYSMTKPVVAAGAALLVEDGQLTLETPVADIVPELAGLTVLTDTSGGTEPARPMTLAHLLTHTCGLANSWGNARTAPLYRQAGLVAGAWMYDPDMGGLEGFAQRLGRLPLEHQPGTHWIYGYGLDIAGLVIERVSGERLGAFLRRRIFSPLGMSSTGFYVPAEHSSRLTGLYTGADGVVERVAAQQERLPLIEPYADGGSAGLITSLEDYGRFAGMLANGGVAAGIRVMSEASAQMMMTPYGPQEAITPALQRFGLGGEPRQALGGVTWLEDHAGPGSAGEYAWGGAAGTAFWATRSSGLSVVLMTQLMAPGGTVARERFKPLIYRALAELP